MGRRAQSLRLKERLASISFQIPMADPEYVKILEACRVAPPPESAAPKSLPLTFFDLLWLRFPPVQRLFFYELSLADTSFFETIFPKLKHTLSLILQHYLPLAGNLVWPQESHKPRIEVVEGDGVSLTLAESEADFYHLSGDGFREPTEYHPLVPKLPGSHDRVAVIALQVTLFQSRGFSIGITSHHAILDGRTSTSFMKSWARICNLDITRGSSIPMTELTPFYDRTVIEDPAGLEAIYLNTWLNMEGPNNRSLNLWSPKTPPHLIRCTFELSRQSLQKLKQWVLNNREKKNQQNQWPFHISSFTLTSAYIWVCAAKAQSLRDGNIDFIFAVDARPRLEPPVPTNYFGNCIASRGASIERKELLGENGVIIAAEAISEAIKSLEEGALKGAESWVSIVESVNNVDRSEKHITTAGSPRFEVYSADFGWGKPRKVEIVSIDRTGAFSLADSRNGDGGIEIGLVRKRNEMESFATQFSEGLKAL